MKSVLVGFCKVLHMLTGTQYTGIDDIMVKLTMKQSLNLINIICQYSVEIAYKYMFCLIMEIIYLVKIIQRNKKLSYNLEIPFQSV